MLALLIAVTLIAGSALSRRAARAALDLSGYPWLYLRNGEPLAPGEAVTELIAVGDVMLGRGVVEAVDASQPFAAVAPWLRASDLAFANLECVIAEGGIPRPGPYRLRAPPSAANLLSEAGFDVLGLANNHALDYGAASLAETVSRLQEAGINTVGAGPNDEAARRPLTYEANGMRFVFLAFNAVPDPEDGGSDAGWTRAGWNRERIAAAISAARAQADQGARQIPTVVVVSAHWGYEYQLRSDPVQRDMALAMLDAGADLVVGHHPHVVQGTHVGVDGLVAYSLGNFVFDQRRGETGQGLALRAFFDARGLRAVQGLPVWAGPRPRLMHLGEARPLLERVAPPDTLVRVGFSCTSLLVSDDPRCRMVAVPQTPLRGIFRVGAIDLTGDGVPEQVQRVQEQVVIAENDNEDGEPWRGLPEWQMVDLALGDPNDDGRSELLLALWKPDDQGVLRSHPFILGYREGGYRVLWGGSAVADPIYEVELGDVDGDGVQELIVLENYGESSNPVAQHLAAVTVWRWHGWGFSLAWRSPPGRYRDMALVTAGAGSPPTISVAVEP
jgi:poly-gamma-glutamate synthesis protein (capsule biosynthesis protein)